MVATLLTLFCGGGRLLSPCGVNGTPGAGEEVHGGGEGAGLGARVVTGPCKEPH